ncbi:hypothetical protein AB4120_05050 [Cupriavidus sp. 2KB_3]|nr:hypothetical protein [Cupriavidus campinensis]
MEKFLNRLRDDKRFARKFEMVVILVYGSTGLCWLSALAYTVLTRGGLK